ncbi:RHS repeat domain-containing protein [Chryseobacterium sp. SIMBA_029]|uniref:RHS repeat domain-containing protein n=1 Tax=Chryseobacterium sp. SIMBA_029 TaxID=3085772 RepID=UPI0039785E44
MEYFPSGETFVENHRNSNYSPYKFNGKELDAETGYYYYGARYYNPRVSLWLNVDPLAEKFPGRSPYEYTFSNPIKFIDPTGMEGENASHVDDIIFRNKKKQEIARIKTDDKRKVYVDINTNFSTKNPIKIDPKKIHKGAKKAFDAVGVSFDLSGTLGGGASYGWEYVYFLGGKDEGKFYGYRKGGANIGVEATAGISAFGSWFDGSKETRDNFSSKGWTGIFNMWSYGEGFLGGTYFWSNRKNVTEVIPETWGGEVIWEGVSITGTIPIPTGFKAGGKWGVQNYELLNGGKPYFDLNKYRNLKNGNKKN